MILNEHIANIKTRYALWIAEWGDKLNYSGAVGIWQYSDKGSVNGISGAVDLDIAYVDYAAMVKAKELNGYSTVNPPVSDEPKNSTNEVTFSVQIGGDSYKGTLTKI